MYMLRSDHPLKKFDLLFIDPQFEKWVKQVDILFFFFKDKKRQTFVAKKMLKIV